MADRLFVFTASGAEAERHYIDTIEEGFAFDNIKKFLSSEEANLIKNIFRDQKIRAWGATPGSGNKRTWNNLQTGDKILIYRNKHFDYAAEVVFKFHNKDLAEHLWKTNSMGQTWEYMYLLDNLTELSVPINEFNKVLGFSDNYVPQGFAQIKEERLQSFSSVDDFLNYLVEGRWITENKEIPKEIQRQIIREKVSSWQISRTEILEQNLENLIIDRLDNLEPGLQLMERQKDLGEVGRLDLLCKNHNYNFVVIELKKSKAGSSVIDQTVRYMGWVKTNLAKPGQTVRGIIIVGKEDTYLRYAAAALPGLIDVKVFDIGLRSIQNEQNPKIKIDIEEKKLQTLTDSIMQSIVTCNEKFMGRNRGENVFKPTNEFLRGSKILKTPVKSKENFADFIDALYKIIIESSGNLDRVPNNFKNLNFVGNEINLLRNYFRHDIEHGDSTATKRQKTVTILKKYTGKSDFESFDIETLISFQEDLLGKVLQFLQDLEKSII